ncbi:hypothetical protein V6N13_067415 [Hibiscus sabdariffa]|uniref:Uncharacterized protein n=1 Tax=Hibiscus sabdariffa TaxID=183260 RepID=A0ABR2DTD8_9ROSI
MTKNLPAPTLLLPDVVLVLLSSVERFSWSFLAVIVASAVELVSMKKITDAAYSICFRGRNLSTTEMYKMK